MSDGNGRGIIHTIVHRAPWWVPWLFLFAMLVGWATYQFQYVGSVAQTNQDARSLIREASLAQCERINDLRADINGHTVVLHDVLATAAETALERENEGAARRYIEHSGDLEKLSMVDCTEAFPEEMEQAGLVAGDSGPTSGPLSGNLDEVLTPPEDDT